MTAERGLADTSLFIARESGRAIDATALPATLAVSAITIGELRTGVLVAASVEARDRRLVTLTAALAIGPTPVDDAVADKWALLRVVLRDRGLRMPINDSWIAATAMALDIPVVTQDDDFPDTDEFDLIRV